MHLNTQMAYLIRKSYSSKKAHFYSKIEQFKNSVETFYTSTSWFMGVGKSTNRPNKLAQLTARQVM